MSNGSNSAAVEHARSGKRREVRDQALISISRYPSATSSEIAMHVIEDAGVYSGGMALIDVVRMSIRVASIQKRISDLLALNYIASLPVRKCKVTGYVAAVYVVAEAGNKYMVSQGMTGFSVSAVKDNGKQKDRSVGLKALRESRALLN